jgi:hypothetical protein
MFAEIEEDVAQTRARLVRSPHRACVIPMGPHRPAPLVRPVDRDRQADCQPVDAAAQGEPVVAFHDQVHVVGLHRVVHDAKALLAPPLHRPPQRLKRPLPSQRRHAPSRPQRHMDGMSRLVRRPHHMARPEIRNGPLPPSPPPPPTPSAGDRKGELSRRACHRRVFGKPPARLWASEKNLHRTEVRRPRCSWAKCTAGRGAPREVRRRARCAARGAPPGEVRRARAPPGLQALPNQDELECCPRDRAATRNVRRHRGSPRVHPNLIWQCLSGRRRGGGPRYANPRTTRPTS